jgi:dihydroxy-acid dehydratase
MNRYSKILTNDTTKGAPRAMLYGLNFKDEDFNKALIGVGSMTFDGNPCNVHTGKLANIVKLGIKKNQDSVMKGIKIYNYWSQ